MRHDQTCTADPDNGKSIVCWFLVNTIPYDLFPRIVRPRWRRLWTNNIHGPGVHTSLRFDPNQALQSWLNRPNWIKRIGNSKRIGCWNARCYSDYRYLVRVNRVTLYLLVTRLSVRVFFFFSSVHVVILELWNHEVAYPVFESSMRFFFLSFLGGWSALDTRSSTWFRVASKLGNPLSIARYFCANASTFNAEGSCKDA